MPDLTQSIIDPITNFISQWKFEIIFIGLILGVIYYIIIENLKDNRVNIYE
jgi:hypothetical protein